MATTLFLRTRSTRHEGKTCRAYIMQDREGTQQFTATAFRVPGRITIYRATAPDRPIVLAKPRRSFPLTGRYDVFAGDDDELLGMVTRSGRFYDARGHNLGRLRDARTWKEHVGEGVVTAMVEGIIAGDSASGVARGADAYLITIGDERAGTLARERVPFEVEVAEARPGFLARALAHPAEAGGRRVVRAPPAVRLEARRCRCRWRARPAPAHGGDPRH